MANPFKKPRRQYRLSEAGRAALRANAMKNRPWEHSTGPHTFEGKVMAGQNALKHGYYCKNPVFPDTLAFRAFVRSQSRDSDHPRAGPAGPPVMEE